LDGQFIEQGFDFIEEVIEPFNVLFEAGCGHAQLITGGPPGVYGMVR
jgi:hypothetical protein